MVRSSSINPTFTTIVGLCVANAFTGLSGCLLAQSPRSPSDINIGTGMVTIALASLLIGQVLLGKGSILTRAIGVVVGAFALPSGVYHRPAAWICPPSCSSWSPRSSWSWPSPAPISKSQLAHAAAAALGCAGKGGAPAC